ncbi:hypothetical protein KFL_008260050 [Klebsormidium nitens]|uniref:Uncharacterized protein n=1 Tax=Klebsormidium nitens TaxID=105231 RepID=A0A1Y1ILY5_KLENI|nr:hypothetical protein KFL_008260050 [Klebsormidium nitens]|eukprot:GAQ91653.1 hypothetical protein KFL_008260050 [Klebsormidium nitens]
MASAQEGAAQQAALHAFLEQQEDSAAQAAAKAPSDQAVTHPLGQGSQEKEELAQEQREMHKFFEKQSQTAAAAAAHAPSDQEVTHSLDPEHSYNHCNIARSKVTI